MAALLVDGGVFVEALDSRLVELDEPLIAAKSLLGLLGVPDKESESLIKNRSRIC